MDAGASIIKTLATNRILLIVLVILMVILIIILIAALVTLSNIKTKVNEIDEDSNEALAIVKQTAADGENTLTLINSTAARANRLETVVYDAIANGFCKIPLFQPSAFCQNLPPPP